MSPTLGTHPRTSLPSVHVAVAHHKEHVWRERETFITLTHDDDDDDAAAAAAAIVSSSSSSLALRPQRVKNKFTSTCFCAPSVCADISCWLTSKLCRPRTTNVKFGLPQRASLLTNLSSGPWKFKLWITVFEEEEAEGATNFDGIFAQFKWPETCFQLKCCNFLLPSSVNRLGDFLHFGQPFKAGGNNYLTQIAHIC